MDADPGASRQPKIYTIGHSTHTLERFTALLYAHRIQCIVDVRSMPYSRWQPVYNRENIARDLPKWGIQYCYAGAKLGVRSPDPACYEQGRVVYSRLAATPDFEKGIATLKELAAQKSTAIMCAEQEPLECHRTLLVARRLIGVGIGVEHIHADGSLETHHQAMLRLLDLFKIPAEDLFRSTEEIIEEACLKQEKRVAWVNPELV